MSQFPWEWVLKFLPILPITLFYLMLRYVTRTHVLVFVEGKPGRYLVGIENLDDVGSGAPMKFQLRIRGRGRFAGPPRSVGHGPWPISCEQTVLAGGRTAVITADALQREEQWLFDVRTTGEEQALDVTCWIGRRPLRTVATDGTSEYVMRPSLTPIPWIAMALVPVLYWSGVASLRAWLQTPPLLSRWDVYLGAPLALLLAFLAAISLRHSANLLIDQPRRVPAYPPNDGKPAKAIGSGTSGAGGRGEVSGDSAPSSESADAGGAVAAAAVGFGAYASSGGERRPRFRKVVGMAARRVRRRWNQSWKRVLPDPGLHFLGCEGTMVLATDRGVVAWRGDADGTVSVDWPWEVFRCEPPPGGSVKVERTFGSGVPAIRRTYETGGFRVEALDCLIPGRNGVTFVRDIRWGAAMIQWWVPRGSQFSIAGGAAAGQGGRFPLNAGAGTTRCLFGPEIGRGAELAEVERWNDWIEAVQRNSSSPRVHEAAILLRMMLHPDGCLLVPGIRRLGVRSYAGAKLQPGAASTSLTLEASVAWRELGREEEAKKAWEWIETVSKATPHGAAPVRQLVPFYRRDGNQWKRGTRWSTAILHWSSLVDSLFRISRQPGGNGFATPARWQLVEAIADVVAQRLLIPSGDPVGRWPWNRTLGGLLAAWVILDRGERMALQHGQQPPALWREKRDWLRRQILDSYRPDAGFFSRRSGRPEVDASALLVPILGFLPAHDERVVSTTNRVLSRLADDDEGLLRFREKPGPLFIPGCFWAAEVLAMQGRKERAKRMIDRAIERFGIELPLVAPAPNQPSVVHPASLLALIRAERALERG